MNPRDLSDDALFSQLIEDCHRARATEAGVICLLIEVEDRRLDLRSGCSSLWDYCLRRLGMSESETSRRITAARMAREIPFLLDEVASSRLTLSTLVRLRDHITPENASELVDAVRGLSRNEVEELLAMRAPRPDVPARLRKLPASRARSRSYAMLEPLSDSRYRLQLTASKALRDKIEHARSLMRHRNPSGDLAVIVEAAMDLLVAQLESERLGRLRAKAPKASRTPQAQQRQPKPNATASASAASASAASASAASALEGSASAGSALAGSAAPAVRSSFAAAAPAAPLSFAAATPAAPSSLAAAAAAAAPLRARRRYISRGTRRAVFERDGAQCTYVSAEGRRCPSRDFLEIHHVHAYGLGGSNDVENLRVTCHAHNGLYAEDDFGRDAMDAHRYFSRDQYAPHPSDFGANVDPDGG